MKTETKIQILEAMEKDENLSPLSRLYISIIKNKFLKAEKIKEKLNLLFISWNKDNE